MACTSSLQGTCTTLCFCKDIYLISDELIQSRAHQREGMIQTQGTYYTMNSVNKKY